MGCRVIISAQNRSNFFVFISFCLSLYSVLNPWDFDCFVTVLYEISELGMISISLVSVSGVTNQSAGPSHLHCPD